MDLLTLAQASQIIDGTLAKAPEMKFRPMSVAVLDAGGHLIAFKREDNSSIMRPQIAQAKAWGSLAMGMSGRALAARAETHPSFVAALGSISEGRIAPVPGGVLILDAEGHTLGAVGVTGDHSDHDETCAIAGIEDAGFKAGV